MPWRCILETNIKNCFSDYSSRVSLTLPTGVQGSTVFLHPSPLQLDEGKQCGVCAAISADLSVTVCLVSHSHTQQSATELLTPLFRPTHPDP